MLLRRKKDKYKQLIFTKRYDIDIPGVKEDTALSIVLGKDNEFYVVLEFGPVFYRKMTTQQLAEFVYTCPFMPEKDRKLIISSCIRSLIFSDDLVAGMIQNKEKIKSLLNTLP